RHLRRLLPGLLLRDEHVLAEEQGSLHRGREVSGSALPELIRLGWSGRLGVQRPATARPAVPLGLLCRSACCAARPAVPLGLLCRSACCAARPAGPSKRTCLGGPRVVRQSKVRPAFPCASKAAISGPPFASSNLTVELPDHLPSSPALRRRLRR